MKEERDMLEERMHQQAASTEQKMESWHRESRLLSSAVFELGVRMVDKTIQSQMMSAADRAAVHVPVNSGVGGAQGQQQGGGFMNTQREALARSTQSSSAMATPPPGAGGSVASSGN